VKLRPYAKGAGKHLALRGLMERIQNLEGTSRVHPRRKEGLIERKVERFSM